MPVWDVLGTPEDGHYRSLPQIKARGWWTLLQSVLRYVKTHALLRAHAQTPVRILEYGAQEITALGTRAEVTGCVIVSFRSDRRWALEFFS